MSKSQKLLLGTLFLLLIPSFFVNIGIVPLYLEEPRRVLVALEMVFSGNWIVPTQLSEYYYYKTPLFNWVIAAAFTIFGSYAEWVPRVVTVFSLFGIGALNYWFTGKHSGKRVALFSTLFYLVSVDLYYYFSMFAEIDVFYSLLSFASIILIYHFYKTNQKWLLYTVPYFLAGLGFLTKGFPSPIFIGATYFALFALNKKWKALFHPLHLVGVAIFSGVVVGYFYAYSFYNDPWLYIECLWSQSSDRAIWSMLRDLAVHLFAFPLDTLKNILPAGFLILFAFNKQAKSFILKNDFLRFCLFALVVNISIYWISPGTKARYVYMLYPFIIILLTALYFKFKDSMPKMNKVFETILLVVTSLGLLGCFVPFFYDIPNIEFVPNINIIAIVMAVVIGIILFYSFKVKRNRVLLFIMFMVALRFGFDTVVLPIRANTGDIALEKQQAYKMLEVADNGPLYLFNYKEGSSFSLLQAYYIERERKAILSTNYQPICQGYFIAQDWELEGHKYKSVYRYHWRGNDYSMIQFNGCWD